MVRLILVILLIVSMWTVAFAQDQPTVNCATVEQCRVLVLVARGQLISAQDAWAFWAEKAQKMQEQLEKLHNDMQTKRQENKDAESK